MVSKIYHNLLASLNSNLKKKSLRGEWRQLGQFGLLVNSIISKADSEFEGWKGLFKIIAINKVSENVEAIEDFEAKYPNSISLLNSLGKVS